MRHAQLRAFYRVALHGGFSRAAEAMGLTQPAVSDQVRKLEQEYDLLLFDRAHKRVALTPQGRGLFDIIVPLFDHEARALEFLSEKRALTSGSLNIVADSAYHLTDLLQRFRKKYPAIKVVVTAGNSQKVISEVTEYRADIGILGSDDTTPDLISLPLATSPIIAFAALGFGEWPEGAATLATLATFPLVLREKASKTRQKLEIAARKSGVEVRPAIEAEGREAVREIVASGAGIGFVSEAEFGHDARLQKIAINGVEMGMTERLVCSARRRDNRMIRAFMTIASPDWRQSFGKHSEG